MDSKKAEKLKKGISVSNVGLVIFSIFFLMLFERLDIIEDNAFKAEEAQLKAVLYLQYLVTGLIQTEESLLMLNKVLCGMPLTKPIKNSLEICKRDQELKDELIVGTIHNLVIGEISINEFKDAWLMREGILTELEDRWELTVEKKDHDILLNKSPFSKIKLPWMKKPLHVNWPY